MFLEQVSLYISFEIAATCHYKFNHMNKQENNTKINSLIIMLYRHLTIAVVLAERSPLEEVTVQ